MTSILAYFLGLFTAAPFIIGMYYIGRREGWADGHLAGKFQGGFDAWTDAHKVLQAVKNELDGIAYLEPICWHWWQSQALHHR